MAHISSIGAVMFTDLAVAVGAPTAGVAQNPVPATYDNAGFAALFTTTSATALKYLQIANVREFPGFGAQPNLVKVPVYGQKTTATIGGQSDLPDFTVTINYVPGDWAPGTTNTTWASNAVSVKGNELGNMVGDGKSRAWRLALMQAQPTGATIGPTQSQYDSNAGGLGKIENSVFYFMGKLESIQVTPSLTDSLQATLSFSIQSAIYGPYTQ